MNAIGGSIIRHRILIVDDAQDNVDMLEAFLAEEASAIKGVTQSNQVERVFNEFEPDLMLLDLHMPAPDGLEILRNLRSVRESLGFLPVIVLTGDTGRTARNSALLLGADDFLLKPLDRQEVVLRVRNLLRTRRLWVELAEANRALERKLH
jgi:putative two-component system response regulator